MLLASVMSTWAVIKGNGPLAGMTIAFAQRSLTGAAAEALITGRTSAAATSRRANKLDKSGRITTDSADAKPEQPVVRYHFRTALQLVQGKRIGLALHRTIVAWNGRRMTKTSEYVKGGNRPESRLHPGQKIGYPSLPSA